VSLVLVAEDEPGMLEILGEAVEQLGHEVLCAHDGREALSLAQAHQPHLVVSDEMMPRLSGLELRQCLQEDAALSQVPFILVSAAEKPPGQDMPFLAKPFDLTRFEELVARVLPTRPPQHEAGWRVGRAQGGGATELLNWMSHEIKTPLAAAMVNLHLLERGLGPSGDRARIEVIARQLESIRQLVESLLDSSRLAEGRLALHLELQDYNAFLRRLVDEWRTSRPDVAFELVCPQGVVEFRLDRVRIEQVLNNLLGNAVKYGARSRVEIHLQLTTSVALTRVTDHGRGIAAADQRRLFARFKRVEVEEGPGGHGLGLFIASEIARLHGGALQVESQLGRGSTFTLSLPRSV
jgi:two-component system sensor histidine kinase/response regulator